MGKPLSDSLIQNLVTVFFLLLKVNLQTKTFPKAPALEKVKNDNIIGEYLALIL